MSADLERRVSLIEVAIADIRDANKLIAQSSHEMSNVLARMEERDEAFRHEIRAVENRVATHGKVLDEHLPVIAVHSSRINGHGKALWAVAVAVISGIAAAIFSAIKS